MNSLAPAFLANLPVPPRLLRLLTAVAEYRGKQSLWTQTWPEVLKRLRQVAVIESVESSSRMENVEVGPRTFDRIVREDALPEPTDRSHGLDRIKWTECGPSNPFNAVQAIRSRIPDFPEPLNRTERQTALQHRYAEAAWGASHKKPRESLP